MEPINGRHKTSKFAPEDVISSMPDNVITHILDRLPLQDAVRTGVLSSNWRFKWTMLSQLVFDDNFFKYLSKTKAKKKYVGIISRMLLHLRGAITKFVLSVVNHGYLVLDAEDVNNWILFLSRKGIKDLSVMNTNGNELKLSAHLFSCFELTHLRLVNCYFNPPPTFHGFPNLLSLELRVEFGENTQLGKFFTRCPLLEILTLEEVFVLGKVKAVEIAKVENLKTLSLQLYDLNDTGITSSGTIFELLCSLPKLQELELDFELCTFTEEGGGTIKKIPTAFPCLKALKLSRICLDDGLTLSCAFDLIWSFPNLHTLEITASNTDDDPSPLVDYNPRGQLQLRSVMFEHWKGSENYLCLLKFLLVRSPFLKKIVIRPHSLSKITLEEKLTFASKLLKLHRASPVVDIDLS